MHSKSIEKKAMEARTKESPCRKRKIVNSFVNQMPYNIVKCNFQSPSPSTTKAYGKLVGRAADKVQVNLQIFIKNSKY